MLGDNTARPEGPKPDGPMHAGRYVLLERSPLSIIARKEPRLKSICPVQRSVLKISACNNSVFVSLCVKYLHVISEGVQTSKTQLPEIADTQSE